uniref:Uncharacterized protein n=1 Tax=Anguilla anguilla TaxID=7936 RepID=A0A0E9W9G6_ANGAN
MMVSCYMIPPFLFPRKKAWHQNFYQDRVSSRHISLLCQALSL